MNARAGRGQGYAEAMPRYEYRCRSCGSTFELRRPMSQANAPTACPKGHDDTVKLLSTVSVGASSSGSSSASSASAAPESGASGGGCCGGGCCS
jgi:putative FmdB family regulatory protein